MSIEKDYIKQLKVLRDNYSGKELEDGLGITMRSIQKYLKDEMEPGRDVIRRIRDAFASHSAGRGIKVTQASAATGEIQAKYIAMLEKKVEDLEQAAAERLTVIERQLSEARSDIMMMSALQRGFHEYMTEFCAPKGMKPADALKTIRSRAFSSLANMKKEGIQI